MVKPCSIALIRPAPLGCLKWKAGPWVGMAALQHAIRQRQPPWLTVEQRPRAANPRFAEDAIPWFWCWMETADLERHASTGRPFIAGPNLYPNRCLGLPNCVRVFVHSDHQLAWLERGSKANLRSKTAFWPYPISPLPDGPLPLEYDVLFYRKKSPSGAAAEEVLMALTSAGLKVAELRYGRHTRSQLFDVARRAHCCVYWSKWDMGSLVQAETMLSGCVGVGIPSSAPWIVSGVNGFLLETVGTKSVAAAVEQALSLDRQAARDWAMQYFDSHRIADLVLGQLATVLEQHVES